MADPFIGEIQMVAFTFPPKGWANCDGQIMAISSNQALFALIRTYFGGNGQTNFALPNLQARSPLGFGNYHGPFASYDYPMGDAGGASDVTLSAANLPQHTHLVNATADGANAPGNANGGFQLAVGDVAGSGYTGAADLTPLNPASCSSAGGGAGHPNSQPSSALLFCIALQGLWPPQN